jgi:hypothetical protein
MKPERAFTQNKGGPEKSLISRRDVEALALYDSKPDSPVLSLYLDTDHSRQPNINRGFEIVFRNMLRDVERPEDTAKQQQLKEDAEVMVRFMDDYRDTRRALVIFSNASENLFWMRELNVNVRDSLRWQPAPYVRPLLEMFDEHERYGVVLTDRQQAKLFTVFLGDIEESKQAFAEADVRHIKGAGKDHPRSQMNIQRKADEHAHWHLKNVASMMSRLGQQHEFDRLILGGTTEVTAELFGLLPKALRARVVCQITLPVQANDADVLAETIKIEEEVERARESDLVERLITAAKKDQKGVLGTKDTLLALQEGRVWQLFYSEGFRVAGAECTNCTALLMTGFDACSYCGKLTRAVDDLVQLATDRVLDADGKIEQMFGPAADRLNDVGAVGAVLRY